MLLSEDSRGEGVVSIFIKHRHGCLNDDGAGIEKLIDEVDGAAGDFDAVVEGRLG
jgi:hypothetical protein